MFGKGNMNRQRSNVDCFIFLRATGIFGIYIRATEVRVLPTTFVVLSILEDLIDFFKVLLAFVAVTS